MLLYITPLPLSTLEPLESFGALQTPVAWRCLPLMASSAGDLPKWGNGEGLIPPEMSEIVSIRFFKGAGRAFYFWSSQRLMIVWETDISVQLLHANFNIYSSSCLCESCLDLQERVSMTAQPKRSVNSSSECSEREI